MILHPPRFDPEERLAVVAHDAGAANIIAAWLAPIERQVQASMKGPATAIWKRTCPATAILSLESALEGADRLISGTGWASSLEHDARVLAAARGIPSVAVVDHWTNYPKRFEREGSLQMPDEVWVTDPYALQLAEQSFPGHPVSVFENTYMKAQVQQVFEKTPRGPADKTTRVLYVLEPIRNDRVPGNEPGEFVCLRFFLKNLDKIFPKACKLEICLRPHPSETPEKYADFEADTERQRIWVDRDGDLAQQIAEANSVVGVDTFALVIALAAGKSCLSTVPPFAAPSILPHTGLKYLRDLVPHCQDYGSTS